jgi:hypothetical protein
MIAFSIDSQINLQCRKTSTRKGMKKAAFNCGLQLSTLILFDNYFFGENYFSVIHY